MAQTRSLREQVKADLKLFPQLGPRLTMLTKDYDRDSLAEIEEYQRGVLIVKAVNRLQEVYDERYNYILHALFFHGRSAASVARRFGIQPHAIEWVGREIVKQALREFKRVGLSPYADDQAAAAQ